MNVRKLAAGLAGAALILALAIVVHRLSERRSAAAELASAREERNRLNAQATESEKKIKDAERIAAEAEQDRQDLAKTLAALRAEQAASVATGRPPPSIPSTAPVVAATLSEAEAQAAREEQFRLAQERAYSQALSRQRKEEATQRAAFAESLRSLEPVEKFNRRIEMAEAHAARAEFQMGIRVFNEAMAEKPADLPVPESAKALGDMLRDQNVRMNVTLLSDGETIVSITAFRMLGRFTAQATEIMPGNYEVIGRRTGYQDVVMRLELRNGQPPPVLSVVCTQPREK